MKICVSLDSTSYTTIYQFKTVSVDEAVRKLFEMENNNPSLHISVEDENGTPRISLDDGDERDRYFVTAYVFDVPDNDEYATIWWHAYDGTGIKLLGTGDYEMANTLKQNYVKDYWEGEYDLGDCEPESNFAIVDTDNEWECIEVVDLKEVA